MDREEFDSLTTTLAGEFRKEVEELRRLQAEAERKKLEKVDSTEGLIKQFVEQQVTEAQQRAKNRQFVMRWIVIPMATVIAGGGGFGVYAWKTAPKPASPEVQEQERQETVKAAVSPDMQHIQANSEANTKRIERIVDIQMDQQVQLIDATDYLGDKLDKISSRAASVDEPPSLQDGRTKAEAIKRARESKDVGYDPADPLGDIPSPPPRPPK